MKPDSSEAYSHLDISARIKFVVEVKPIVTIGVCVKDCEKSIKETIESIVAQDFSNDLMEIIFVDDGSRDMTLQIILDSIHDVNMNVKVFHSDWKGLGPARNVVVNNSSGVYILWVDGDMLLPKDHVRKQVEFMEKNPNVGIAKARYSLLPNEKLVEFLENVACVAEDARAGDEWKTDLRLPGAGGSIFHVKAIRQVTGFDISFKGTGEDQDIAYRIKEAGWQIKRSNAFFYEKRSKTWGTLWKKYLWYGYGDYHLYRKNRNLFTLHRMVPFVQFVAGLFYAVIAYKLTHRKTVLILPFDFAFKMTAWCIGFMMGQIECGRGETEFLKSYDDWRRVI